MKIGFLIIGNEILSGRTVEKNLPSLAGLLAEKGLRISEARIIADSPVIIAAVLREMKNTHNYVFTSGGIGPTHDDVTIDGAALAFGTVAEENDEALAILSDFYRNRGLEFTRARRRMARAPRGASILKSNFPGAPGFVMENVFICAGVPEIFNIMAAAAISHLPELPKQTVITLRVNGPESELAEALEHIQQQWSQLEIGSYPKSDDKGFYCNLVFSGTDKSAIKSAVQSMGEFAESQNMPHEIIEV